MTKSLDYYSNLYRSNDTSPWGHDEEKNVDYYENQNRLKPGMAFIDCQGDIVRLYQRVPGDGTQWFVEDYNDASKGWYYYSSIVEPGDLKIRLPEFDC